MSANPSTQRMFLVSISGITGTWQTKTGGDTTSDVTKNYDGGALSPALMASPAETDNIVVSRVYDHDRDYTAHKNARAQVGRWTTTVSVTPTDVDLKSRGKATVYSSALLVRCSEPDSDSSSGDGAMWELEFAVGQAK